MPYQTSNNIPSCSSLFLVTTGQHSGAGVHNFSVDFGGLLPALELVRIDDRWGRCVVREP